MPISDCLIGKSTVSDWWPVQPPHLRNYFPPFFWCFCMSSACHPTVLAAPQRRGLHFEIFAFRAPPTSSRREGKAAAPTIPKSVGFMRSHEVGIPPSHLLAAVHSVECRVHSPQKSCPPGWGKKKRKKQEKKKRKSWGVGIDVVFVLHLGSPAPAHLSSTYTYTLHIRGKAAWNEIKRHYINNMGSASPRTKLAAPSVPKSTLRISAAWEKQQKTTPMLGPESTCVDQEPYMAKLHARAFYVGRSS